MRDMRKRVFTPRITKVNEISKYNTFFRENSGILRETSNAVCASPVHMKKRTPKIPAQQFENCTDGDDEHHEMYAKKAKKTRQNR